MASWAGETDGTSVFEGAEESVATPNSPYLTAGDEYWLEVVPVRCVEARLAASAFVA